MLFVTELIVEIGPSWGGSRICRRIKVCFNFMKNPIKLRNFGRRDRSPGAPSPGSATASVCKSEAPTEIKSRSTL